MMMKKKKSFHSDDLKEVNSTDLMARALVVGLATMLSKNGIARPQLKTANKEGYLVIFNAVEQCLDSEVELRKELNLLRRRGPARYLKYATSDIRKEISGH